MEPDFKILLVQMEVGADRNENISRACRYIRMGEGEGIDVAVLPEMFLCPYDTAVFGAYAEEEGGYAYETLRALSAEMGIIIVAGSMPECDGDRLYNTCYVFDSGRCIAKHRKAHLFDIDVPNGQYFKESDTLSAGDSITVFDTKYGLMGVCICFDIRFSDFIRETAKQGIRILFVPAAFNMTTGPAHWELLMRARAVDNQIFVAAASPARDNSAGYVSYAHSLVVNPWGEVEFDCGVDECVTVVGVVLDMVDNVRKQIPIGN